MGFLFGGKKGADQLIDEGLRGIQDLYKDILNLQHKISRDIGDFFAFEKREKRLTNDIGGLEGMKRDAKIRRAHDIMKREHDILRKEKEMLDNIRMQLRRTVRNVKKQVYLINKIQKSL